MALACLAGVAAFALDDARTAAEVRIGVPLGVQPVLSIEPGSSLLELDLPSGAVFPVDFEAATGGLVRGESLTTDTGRVKLTLTLNQGVLERIVYDPEGILLRFASRFGSPVAENPEDNYILGPTDGILVLVHGQTDMSGELTIGRDGTLTAPRIGEIQAAGMTPRQLAKLMTDRLGARYLVDPKVDVEVTRYRSQWVIVSGEVRDPGRIALKGGTRLKEVLGDAGGLAEGAGETIVISRGGRSGEPNETVRIDRAAFELGREDPLLRHGDIVEVPRANFCYVQGEVRNPDRVRIERGMTLLRALTLVGGLTDWADRKSVRILHLDQEGGGETVVNVRKVQAGKVADPVLKGGEIIVVNRRFF